jgi:hypothetical protein
LRLLALLLLAVLALAPAYLVFRRVSALGRASRRVALLAAAFGAVLGGVAYMLETAVLGFTELSFDVRASGVGAALLATFLLSAPLEEAFKTSVVWPIYRTRRIDSPRLGLCYAVAAAAGFALAMGALRLSAPELDVTLAMRVLCHTPAHLFFAGVWGFALGARSGQSGHWFSVSWLSVVLLHGLYAHIVWGRGPGFLVAVVPLLLFMGLGAASALREVSPRKPAAGLLLLPEPPRLSLVQEALSARDQPLLVRWVILGAFVNVGLMLTLTASAVLIGHRLGIDFAAADETDIRSAGPLVLLGSAVLIAFPVAGYLVARASGSTGVLESGLAAAAALAAIIAVLSLVAPLGVLFALAVAPLAFGLACGGAWIGVER